MKINDEFNLEIELNKVHISEYDVYFKPIQLGYSTIPHLNKDPQHIIVVYYLCNKNGVFKSLRDGKGNIMRNQPYYCSLEDWNKKFKLIQ